MKRLFNLLVMLFVVICTAQANSASVTLKKSSSKQVSVHRSSSPLTVIYTYIMFACCDGSSEPVECFADYYDRNGVYMFTTHTTRPASPGCIGCNG